MKRAKILHSRRMALAVRLALICTLWFAAYAHLTIGFTNSADAEYASAYTLPDGSLPILCLTGSEGTGHAISSACDFCRIADDTDLTKPCASDFTQHSLIEQLDEFIANQTLATEKHYRFHGSPRAPPTKA